MSGKVYGEAFCSVPKRIVMAEGLSLNAKVLYSIFACYVDGEGRCYPGRKHLAKVMGVSEETVKRAKKELVEATLIECHERFDDGGRRTTDDVLLTPPRVMGDPYPRVMGDPTRTNANKERSTTTRPGVKCDPPGAGEPGPLLFKANGSLKLTDEDRQRGLERLRQLREGH